MRAVRQKFHLPHRPKLWSHLKISKWVRPLRKDFKSAFAAAVALAMLATAYYLIGTSLVSSKLLVGVSELHTIPSPDSDLEWLKIKIERNFVDLFGDNSVPVTHRSLSHPPAGNTSMQIGGVVERVSDRDVAIQIRLERPGVASKSVTQTAPLELWREAYKSIPAAILFAADIDPNTTKVKASGKRITKSFIAALLYFEAIRMARAPQLDRALSFVDRAIAEDSAFAVAYWAKAQILREMGREPEAATMERLAQSIDPDHSKQPIIGEPINPLPSLFQRLQGSDWLGIAEGLLFKKIEQESYGIVLHVWSFSPDAYRLGVAMVSSPYGGTVAELRKEHNAILVINGGFFDIDRESRLTPSGLVISGGKMISGISGRGGSGVVYDADGRIGIDFSKSVSVGNASAAVQVGPLVVDPGGKNGIRRNDFDRQSRSAICLSRDGKLIVMTVTGGGLSLFELGEIMSASGDNGGLGCERALNLDGGPSTQVSFQNEKNVIDIAGRWKIPNGLIVVRR